MDTERPVRELQWSLRPRARAVLETDTWMGLLVTAVATIAVIAALLMGHPAFLPSAPGVWLLVAVGLAAAQGVRLTAESWTGRYVHARRVIPLVAGLAFLAPAVLMIVELTAVLGVNLVMRTSRPMRALTEAAAATLETALAIMVFRLVAMPGDATTPRTWIALTLAVVVATVAKLTVEWALDDGGDTAPQVALAAGDVQALVVGTATAVGCVILARTEVAGAGIAVVAATALMLGSLLDARAARTTKDMRHIADLQSSLLHGIPSGAVAGHAAAALLAPLEATAVGIVQSGTGHVVALADGSVLDLDEPHELQRLVAESLGRVAFVLVRPAEIVELAESLGLDEVDHHVAFAPIGTPSSAQGLLWAMRPADDATPYTTEHRALLLQAAQETGQAISFTRRLASLERQASFDELTGLPSRASIETMISAAVADGLQSDTALAILLIDLNGFKEVNDTLGHQTGDVVLAEIGQRIAAVGSQADAVGRLGGDEFIVLLSGDSAAELARQSVTIAEELAAAVAAPVAHGDLVLDLSVSIGVARFPDHGDGPEELIRAADVAMYAAKARGETLTVYEGKLDRHRTRRLGLATDLRAALAARALTVVFQPKVSFVDGRLVGAEALIRWFHPTLGPIPAGEIIVIAEHAGLLRELTDFVLHQAAAHCAALRAEGIEISIAVNLTERDIADHNLPDRIQTVLDAFELPAGSISVEVTETALLTQEVEALGVLPRVSDMGVPLAIDDFGTGFSSLSHLRKFPVDEIKIDMSFVERMVIRTNDAVIVRSIVELGHSLGIRVTAEGVETNEAWAMLEEFGTDVAQGNHVMKAIDASSFMSWAPFWEGHRELRGHAAGRRRQAPENLHLDALDLASDRLGVGPGDRT